jgi:uncharacterized protein
VPSALAFDEVFVEFGKALRQAGLKIGTNEVMAFCEAAANLDPSDIADVYFSGRTTLVHRKEQLPIYDAKFREYFLAIIEKEEDFKKVILKSSANAQSVLEIPATDTPPTPNGSEEEARLGLMASVNEIYRVKAFSQCTPIELVTLRKIMSTLKLAPPRRKTRRVETSMTGTKVFMKKMVREFMRTQGDPKDLYFSQRKLKLRRIIFILDVSGSMADYSRNLLQFAYSAKRANSKVEVFCFGTRLTRITNQLDRKNPDEAMEQAGKLVLDWDGGTRIGDSLTTFVKKWGRAGASRGSIVVICSDGLDRGDPEVLENAMQTLSRISHRIIWMNPNKGDSLNFEPNTLGMKVAAPYIDEIVSGHNLKSLEEFCQTITALR